MSAFSSSPFSFQNETEKKSDAPLSQEEIYAFHNIDRHFFARLVFTLKCEPAEAMHVSAFWIWLERLNKAQYVAIIVTCRDDIFKAIFKETILCLKVAESNSLVCDGELPMVQGIIGKEKGGMANLRFYYENRLNLILGVGHIVEDVCLRAFPDLIKIAYDNRYVPSENHKTPLPDQTLSNVVNDRSNVGVIGRSGFEPIVSQSPLSRICEDDFGGGMNVLGNYPSLKVEDYSSVPLTIDRSIESNYNSFPRDDVSPLINVSRFLRDSSSPPNNSPRFLGGGSSPLNIVPQFQGGGGSSPSNNVPRFLRGGSSPPNNNVPRFLRGGSSHLNHITRFLGGGSNPSNNLSRFIRDSSSPPNNIPRIQEVDSIPSNYAPRFLGGGSNPSNNIPRIQEVDSIPSKYAPRFLGGGSNNPSNNIPRFLGHGSSSSNYVPRDEFCPSNYVPQFQGDRSSSSNYVLGDGFDSSNYVPQFQIMSLDQGDGIDSWDGSNSLNNVPRFHGDGSRSSNNSPRFEGGGIGSRDGSRSSNNSPRFQGGGIGSWDGSRSSNNSPRFQGGGIGSWDGSSSSNNVPQFQGGGTTSSNYYVSLVQGDEASSSNYLSKLSTNIVSENTNCAFETEEEILQREILIDQLFNQLQLNDDSEDQRFGEKPNVHPSERTIFLTFSKGYPILEHELRKFLNRSFGDIIETLHMQEVGEREQSLYARLVVRDAKAMETVLTDRLKTKFTINGKHVWARKYVNKIDHHSTISFATKKKAK